MIRRLQTLVAVFSVVIAAGNATAVYAQPDVFPSRPINLVVPYPPGGTNDNVARIVSKRLSEKLHQPVVVDYKPGAGGTIGAGFVASAPADGYTLLNASIGNLAIAPQLVPVRFDPFADLTPIAYVGGARTAIAVNPQLPVRTLQELIDYARAHPGKLSYGTSGNGTPGHLAGEYFKQLTGVDIRHVPYRGSAQAVADVVAGHVDVVFDPLGNQFVRSGKLRALAFFGGPTAPADLAGVPSIAQAGVKNWEDGLAGSFFIVASSHLPPAVLTRLQTTVADILREPDTVKALADVQVVAQALSPKQAAEQIRGVHDLAARLIASSKVRPD
ncbi:tripartite tricarboxylate transporter substrate binding protein [Xylophilus sp. GOD-11R]|uniref:Bug family tripartite tricarboxylate transporter substrate binding protein n=1 Tax=Xylophilus sp. GOD-11R TaxID=3089814 RepID=UPI00298CFE73|nr:tripartite tricarboxylate transporter substrate binding protein [Xylophilus sp. GOD-11R]WPB55792.1 tripartite tricarboxylate transporter substrate binding protein [Xylophilus sp. GOD-11R]